MIFETQRCRIDHIDSPLLKQKNINMAVARLDQLHPVVSGNKPFKLFHFIEKAKKENKKRIVTFGGAYSNHLIATAYYCKKSGLPSTGIVRGEKPETLSHTLSQCISYGMDLKFISRLDYTTQEIDSICHAFDIERDKAMIIPEGGYHPLGAKGAEKITNQIADFDATHICTAVGTATTLAGLLEHKNLNQTLIGIPVLKGMNDIRQRLSYLIGTEQFEMPVIWDTYHFGGYARRDNKLIEFMNRIYDCHKIETDFVYTAKMMFGIFDKMNQDFFPEGSKIIAIHTGGLQGNLSLPGGTLNF
ncbi:MAG: pyridoxal-phosphate dependent enzyme [Ferruginibacter sp.]|nr:pyridoxal-phosphate dependent enzyme [Ferruginibacter sp.]